MPTPNQKNRRTIHDEFLRIAGDYAGRTLFRAEGGQGRSYTYGQVAEFVSCFSRSLRADGSMDTPEIGLLSENCPEWCISYLSILAAGRTVLPIDTRLKPEEIRSIVTHARLRTVVVSAALAPILSEMADDLHLISLDDDSPDSWRHLLKSDPEPTLPFHNETAVIIYTSGTTGTPKTVELTHANLLANLEGVRSSIQFDEHDVFLSILPLYHTFEATCGFLTPLMSGATIVYARSLKSKEIIEDLSRNRATVMCGMPLLYEKMYYSFRRKIAAAPWFRRMLFRVLYVLSGILWKLGFKVSRLLFRSLRGRAGMDSIRIFVSGGAAIPSSIARFFNLIGFDFIQGYGMTEASPVITVHRPENIKFGSVGPPLNNVEVRIDSPDEAGIGEIIARGDNISPGYRDNPEATAELVRDGWLYTGDLGRMKDGHLWITGRRKSLIVSASGKNIYPEELEEKLVEHAIVLEAVVFGRKKQGRQGEEVRAIIVPDQQCWDCESSSTKLDEDKINQAIKDAVAEVNSHVATYKRIVGYEIQYEELEKTSTRKVKRFLYQ
ncbi:MAG: AMP-binding protein [candidate division Zixibacteria bacterium]|nr:AMP-binding protein [candidate division Zixibacteria bacterium]